MNLWQFIDKHPVWTLVYLLIIAATIIVPSFARATIMRNL